MSNRIDELRNKAGLTVQELADKAGITRGYLNELKSGKKRLNVDTMNKLAAALGCNPEDFITSANKLVPVVGYIGAGAEVYPIDDFAKGEGLEEVIAPPETDPASVVALKVKGDSMVPLMYEDWIVYYSKRQDGVPSECINKICIVKLKNDAMLVKDLKRGYTEGRYNLESPNASTIENADVEWASKVLYIKLP